MRWDGLFADLEAQWDHERQAQVIAEARELTRGEWAAISLRERLRAARGRTLRLDVAFCGPLDLSVQTVAPTWVGGRLGSGQSAVVALDALTGVDGVLDAAVLDEAAPRSGGPGLGTVLRSLARQRAPVELTARDGRVAGQGTIDRVGADHVDLARHARDDARRADAVRGRVVVPIGALAIVRADRSPL